MKKLLVMFAAAGLVAGITSCDKKKDANPFFTEWNTPFGVPPFDEIRPEHFVPALEEGMRLENEEIEAIINNPEEPTFENVIIAYGNTGLFLSRVQSVFSNLCSADLNDDLQKIQEQMSPVQTKHRDNISLNPQLFEKVKAVYEKRDELGLSREQMRLLDKVYSGFVRSGANLSDDDKAEYRRINEALSKATLAYAKNVRNDNGKFELVIEDEADLAGLPDYAIAAAAEEAASRGKEGKWVFTIDKPSMIPFLQYADNRDLREKIYYGYTHKADNNDANDNKAIIGEIVNLRLKKANLLGYDSHAHFGLERTMAKNEANVYQMLNELWTPALALAKKELAEMQAIKVREGQGSDFASWDWWYYAEKLRKEKYDLDEDMLKPYFPLNGVRDGIFLLVDNLYGITFKEMPNAPKYHPENQVYEVLEKDGSHLGVIYMDFHPRAGKKVGAWCTSFRPQRYANGQRVAPISSIVCNFTKPTGNTPALLTLDEVETFFHEFGHAMHGLTSDVELPGLRGVSRDFVELPSQIMENWATDPVFIKMYAKHYQTGEVIPDELVEKIQNSGHFNQGFMVTENIAASLLDMDYHSIKSEMPNLNVDEFERNSLKKRGLIDQIEPRYRSTYFQHIFSGGYSAGYYSYKWSEILDSDAFQAFVESGDVLNKQVAESFRKNILERGSELDEMELYVNFRGREPSKEPLMEKLGLK